MALKIGSTTVVDNSNNGTFNEANLAPGYAEGSQPSSTSSGEIIYNKTYGRLQFRSYDSLSWIPDLSPSTRNGVSAATAGTSAYQIMTEYSDTTDGWKYIKVNDFGDAKLVYCIMDSSKYGGGYMLLHRAETGEAGARNSITRDAVNEVTDTSDSIPSNEYKLADHEINYIMKNTRAGVDRPDGHYLPIFVTGVSSSTITTVDDGENDFFTIKPRLLSRFRLFRGRFNALGSGNGLGTVSDRGWDDYSTYNTNPNMPSRSFLVSSDTFASIDDGETTQYGSIWFISYNVWGNQTVYNATNTGGGYHTNTTGWVNHGALWMR